MSNDWVGTGEGAREPRPPHVFGWCNEFRGRCVKTTQQTAKAPRRVVGPRVRVRTLAFDVRQLLAPIGSEAAINRAGRGIEADRLQVL